MRITYLTYDNDGTPMLLDPTGAVVNTTSLGSAGLNEAFAGAVTIANFVAGSKKNKLYAPNTGSSGAAIGDLSPASGNQLIQ